MKMHSKAWAMLSIVCILCIQVASAAPTNITYDVTALIDVADVLLVRGAQAQWYHPGSGAAVGRHSGANEPTTISSTLNGLTNLDEFAWFPIWPEDPPAEIRYAAYSLPLNDLAPSLPSARTAVDVNVLQGRGSASIAQFPDATNGWTLMVRFADGASGAASLTVRISVDLVSLRVVTLSSNVFQIRWPTNAASYQLESAFSLPAMPTDWVAVTNPPVILGQEFAVHLDTKRPRAFFRLRSL